MNRNKNDNSLNYGNLSPILTSAKIINNKNKKIIIHSDIYIIY